MARIDVGGIGGFIRDQRDQAQMSLRQLAKAADVSNPYLSQVERGLRISAETLYVQAGILDEREGDEAVTTAIATDQSLTERQRTTLLQIYAAFQAENRAQAEHEAAATDDHETDQMDDREEAR